MRKTLAMLAVTALIGVGCDAHVQLESKPAKMGESTGVPDRPEPKTVAGEAFKKATDNSSVGQKAESEPVESHKKPLEKTPVESIIKDEKEDWFLSFRLLGSYPSDLFECEVDDITIVFDKSLDGTYVSAGNYYRYRDGVYSFEKVVLYVNTIESNRDWNVYLKKMKDEKKASESPREIIPPGYIKIK